MSAKILVADESPTIHKIVAMAFENEGMTVEGISRGEHVLEYMVDFKPDIVLADIHLPGLDGYQLSREIKDSKKFSSTRVVLLTSDFEDVDEEALKRSRADDTISKPFKSEEILRKVKSQLHISEPEKESPALESVSPPEPWKAVSAENDIIQSEFEDIVSQEKESGQDSVKPSSPKDERPEASIENLDVETPPKPESGKAGEPQPVAVETEAGKSTEPRDDDSQKNEADAGILAEISEEAFREDSHSDIPGGDEFYAVFQSVLASPEFGMEEEDLPAHEPGAKPNLIEETLALMARRNTEEEPADEPEPVAGEEPPVEQEASADLSLGHRVIEAHVDQVKGRLPEGTVNGKDSATLETTVRELLGEVAPEIIRKVIQEEIENIKKMEEA